MNTLLRKHWTSLLGTFLFVCAFVYLFKYTVGQGWITDDLKIGIGLLAGAGAGIAGWKLVAGKKQLAGEIVSGLGSAILYTTFSFAGIYYALWDSLTVFLCMIAVTIGLSFMAYRFGLRVLMNIALLGALVSPLVLRPESDQVFTLFLYLLVINSAYFYLSIRKSWTELRLLAFAGTWLLYIVYYFHFDPEVSALWSMPYRYATAAFVFYVVGLLLSSWKNGLKFDGLNLYMGIVNAVVYGLWSVALLDGFVPYAYPMAAIGLLYLALSFLVFKLTGKYDTMPVVTKFFGGTFLLLLSASQVGKGLETKPLINVYFWCLIAVLLLGAGVWKKLVGLVVASMLVWFYVGCYWSVVTWDTPRGEWFGTYIPFLNWGAVSWMVLAALGFYFSIKISFPSLGVSANRLLANTFAVVSHLMIGGLLTVQVDNIFEEYRLNNFFDLQLTLSVTWGIYALLLFLWGALGRQGLFKWFGSVVLVLVALKVLVLDLSGEDSIYKVLVLFVLGGISFAITFINHKWGGVLESKMRDDREILVQEQEQAKEQRDRDAQLERLWGQDEELTLEKFPLREEPNRHESGGQKVE